MSTTVLPAPHQTSSTSTVSKVVRLAVVGCGAVTKHNHLPILAGHDGIALTTLVDRDENRARDLARAYAVPKVSPDFAALTTAVVAAVVLATPPAHHAPATIALAKRGIHVFVEKPMAIKAADAEAMVDAADRAGIALSVGLYRRTLPAVRLLKSLIETGEFGKPVSVDIEEGGSYGWQLATLDVLAHPGVERSAGESAIGADAQILDRHEAGGLFDLALQVVHLLDLRIADVDETQRNGLVLGHVAQRLELAGSGGIFDQEGVGFEPVDDLGDRR